MIAKGNLHAHGGRLATYMLKGKGDERTELVEARGFLSDDLREAFCAIQAIAETQTQCEKPFFHCYVRLPDNEALDKEKWLAVAGRIETELGFDAQPRAVACHIEPGGETHMHVAWSRIDEKEMRAIDPGLYKNKLTELCRDLEVEYGLRGLQNKRPPEQQTKSPARPEFEEARRLGVDVDATRETIRACFDRSDNGPGFAVALAEHGLGLARGDERDFVVVDQEGGLHALGKRICGVTAKAVRERLGSEFRQSLPSVDETRQRIELRREASLAASAKQEMTAPSFTPHAVAETIADRPGNGTSNSVAAIIRPEMRETGQALFGEQAVTPNTAEGIKLDAPYTADVADRIGNGAGKLLNGVARIFERLADIVDGLIAPTVPEPTNDTAPEAARQEADAALLASKEEQEYRQSVARALAAMQAGQSSYEQDQGRIDREAQSRTHSSEDDDGGRIHGYEYRRSR